MPPIPWRLRTTMFLLCLAASSCGGDPTTTDDVDAATTADVDAGAPAESAVVINEFRAASSEWVLNWDVAPGQAPRLGAHPPWTAVDHDDSRWAEGVGGFGYGDGDDNTDLEPEIRGVTHSLYTRRVFTVSETEAERGDGLILDIDYDDGFVAYLNGREIARKSTAAPGGHIYHEQPAYHPHEAGLSESYAVGLARDLLVPGDNVLAIQGHNVDLQSSDLSLRADLYTAGPDTYHLRYDDTWKYRVGTVEPMFDLRDEDGELSDWIELYNRSDAPVSLDGWALSDREGEPTWVFPDITLAAGDYLVVFASGKDRRNPGADSNLHLDFKLDSGGEYLALLEPDGTVANEFSPLYPPQSRFHSYGRVGADGAGDFRYFAPPTPGAANTAGASYAAIAGAPGFTVAQGYYDTAVSLELTASPACTVVYTLDGSLPTADHGTTASGPLTISRSMAVTARTFCDDAIPSEPRAQTYLIGLDPTMKSLPALTIVGDEEKNLFEPHGSMAIVGGQYLADPNNPGCNQPWCLTWQPTSLDDFSQALMHGRSFERPLSFSMLRNEFTTDNVLAGEGFQIDCGSRVSASSWRRPRMRRGDDWIYGNYTKFSFRFYFRNDYGKGKLDYPLFPGSAVTEFDKLVVRGGHNDDRNPFIRDELTRRLFIDTGQIGSHGTFANLFINGEYKGFYNLTERLDDEFQKSWWNTDNDFDILHNFELNSGDLTAWEELFALVNGTDLSIPANYQEVAQRLDVVNFIDYLLVNIYAGTWDWPGNNWHAARERSPTGRFRFHVWDAEGGFGTYNAKPVGFNTIANDLENDDNPIANLYNRLRVSAEFRQLFAERIQLHFFAGGALTDERVRGRHAELRGIIQPMVEALYGPYDNSIETVWIPQRRTNIFNHFQAAGLWP